VNSQQTTKGVFEDRLRKTLSGFDLGEALDLNSEIVGAARRHERVTATENLLWTRMLDKIEDEILQPAAAKR
jgi:hypothetical protein